MGTAEQFSTQIDDKAIIDNFNKRVGISGKSLSEVNSELEQMAAKFDVDLHKLFLLAETDQLPVEECDKALSLFSLASILR